MPFEVKNLPDFLKNCRDVTTLGERLIYMQRQFPKFNFYWDKPGYLSTNDYLMSIKPVPFRYYFEYGQVNRWFLALIRQAQVDYRTGNIERAVWVYETLMQERYPNYKPYDLLIRHYRKTAHIDDEARVLDHSIGFFTDLRARQREYVLSLAHEFGMEWKALESINARKKIHYYGGAFVLYDPVKVMGEWEGRRGLIIDNL